MLQTWNAEKYSKKASFVSELGAEVISLLSPKAGEDILDLGCGDGTLAKKIMAFNCNVIGVDASANMVKSSIDKGVNAVCKNGEKLDYNDKFDAIFTNAALHWMKDYNAVLKGVSQALKKNGRFVGEFGGYGNIRHVVEAIETFYQENPKFGVYELPWFFPTDVEYQALLENRGLVVNCIKLIDRPTPLKHGVRGWLNVFSSHITSLMNEQEQKFFLDQMESLLKPKLYDEQKGWVADYVRLRFSAKKIV